MCLSGSVLWQQLLETGAVSPICIKVVQRTQAKKLAAHTRKMVDYIVFTCPSSANVSRLNQVLYVCWPEMSAVLYLTRW